MTAFSYVCFVRFTAISSCLCFRHKEEFHFRALASLQPTIAWTSMWISVFFLLFLNELLCYLTMSDFFTFFSSLPSLSSFSYFVRLLFPFVMHARCTRSHASKLLLFNALVSHIPNNILVDNMVGFIALFCWWCDFHKQRRIASPILVSFVVFIPLHFFSLSKISTKRHIKTLMLES